MAIDVISNASINAQVVWNVTKNQTGLAGLQSSNTERKLLSYSLGAAANQINEIYSSILTVTAGSSTTLTLTGSLTDVVGNASFTLARVKGIFVWLLGTGDTVNGVTGTAASSITIGNAGTHPIQLFLSDPTYTADILNGSFLAYGTGNATGLPVSAGSHDQLKILNNDGAVDAKVLITIYGAAS